MNDIHDPKSKVFPKGVLRHNDITNCLPVDYSDFDLPIKLTEVLPEIRIREYIDESIYAHVVRELGITVDRDELLRALNYERDQYAAGYAAGFKAAQPKWISVDERLPDDLEEVLILVKETEFYGKYKEFSKCYFCQYIGIIDDGDWCTVWCHGNRYINDTAKEPYADMLEVTHWMPLPQPPKEVNHD